MDETSELLLTIAQISIGFAGFAGVVAAFSRFRLAPEAAIYRVRLMVQVALITLLLSLLPFLPVQFGLSSTDSWRLSALVAGLGIVPISITSWIRVRPLFRAGLLRSQFITTVWYVITVVLAIGLFAAAIGPFAEFAAAVYITMVYFGLVLCSYYFVMLMIAVELEKR